MVEAINTAAIPPAQRARLIYQQAHAELAGRLWQAALGTKGEDSVIRGVAVGDTSDMAMDSFLALVRDMQREGTVPVARQAPSPEPADLGNVDGDGHRDTGASRGESRRDTATDDAGSASGLAPHAGYAGALRDAAERTGIPTGVIGIVVNAEAARDGQGRWLAYSRNPRSSAAGLGQFLTGTWIGEAERPGTWLNGMAATNGWLDGKGHVRREARPALLEKRYDGATSIQAVADYARANLDKLAAKGVFLDGNAGQVARAVYLGHHLGIGDALRFLKEGLGDERAHHLLTAQVGGAAAGRRIAAAGGSAARAHREWLNQYVDSHLRSLKTLSGPLAS